MASQGLPGTAAIATVGDKSSTSSSGLTQIGLARVPADAQPERLRPPSASGARRRRPQRPARRRSASPPRGLGLTRRQRSPSASPAPRPSPASPSAVGLAGRAFRPERRPLRVTDDRAVPSTCPPTGKLADLRLALQAEFGPIDEVSQEATIGPIISAEIDPAGVAADRPRLGRHPGLDHLPLPRLPHGRDGARGAPPRRARGRRHLRHPGHVLRHSRSTPCS